MKQELPVTDHVHLMCASTWQQFRCKNCQFLRTKARTPSPIRTCSNTDFHAHGRLAVSETLDCTVSNCIRPHVWMYTQIISIFHRVSAHTIYKAAQPGVTKHHWWRTWCLKAQHINNKECAIHCVLLWPKQSRLSADCNSRYNLKSLKYTAWSGSTACQDQVLSQHPRMSTEYQHRSTGVACAPVCYAPLICWKIKQQLDLMSSTSLSSHVLFRSAILPLADLHTTVNFKEALQMATSQWVHSAGMSLACQ